MAAMAAPCSMFRNAVDVIVNACGVILGQWRAPGASVSRKSNRVFTIANDVGRTSAFRVPCAREFLSSAESEAGPEDVTRLADEYSVAPFVDVAPSLARLHKRGSTWGAFEAIRRCSRPRGYFCLQR